MNQTREKTVQLPPDGLVIALQFWDGDERQAFDLARLLRNIERRNGRGNREDVTLALCRRSRFKSTAEMDALMIELADVFQVMTISCPYPNDSHPNGCNALWAETMATLSEQWAEGMLLRDSVFLIEPDGCPIREDWIDVIKREQARALAAGKLVSGDLTVKDFETRGNLEHVNGSLVAHLSLWLDRPSLHRTPMNQAWDMFHAATLVSTCRPTRAISNYYGLTALTPPVLTKLAGYTAWLSNVKDRSALTWAMGALA